MADRRPGIFKRLFNAKGLDIPAHAPKPASESARRGEAVTGGRSNAAAVQFLNTLAGGSSWTTVPSAFLSIATTARLAASCPVSVIRRDGAGKMTTIYPGEHPLADILQVPNDYMTPWQFFFHVFASLKSTGGCYLYIDRTGNRPRLLPLPPHALETRLVKWRREFRYKPTHGAEDASYEDATWTGVTTETASESTMPFLASGSPGGYAPPLPGKPAYDREVLLAQDEVIAIHDVSYDGITGISPTGQFSRTLGLAAGIEYMKQALAASGGQPPTAYSIKTPGGHGEAARDNLLEQLANRNPLLQPDMVLTGDVEAKPLSQTPREMGLADQGESMVSDIGRVFGVPPSVLGDERTGTPARSTEESNRLFLAQSIRPLQRAVGEAIRRGIDPNWHEEDEPVEVYWDCARLERANVDSRTRMYSSMLNLGAFTVNEVRTMEGLPPVDGGDELVRGTGGGQETPGDDTGGDGAETGEPQTMPEEE